MSFKRLTLGIGFALAVFAEPLLAADLIDPTQPPDLDAPVDVQVESTDFKLSAIFRVGTRSVAVINGEHVAVGDAIGDSTVKEISASTVRVSGPDGSRTLRLRKSIIKRPSSVRSGENESHENPS